MRLGWSASARCDPDALALAAGELVRVALGERRIEPHHLEQLGRAAVPARGVRPAIDRERLGDDAPHPHPRVERAERILEDDLHALPGGPELPRGQCDQVTALEADMPGAGLDQSQDEPACRGLAAARLAHQAQRLSARDREAHAVDGARSRDGAARSTRRPRRTA